MLIDEKEFFREFTLRICSSLEIEKALWNCFQYVSEIMPADDLSLIVFNSETGIIENVAQADKKGGLSLAVKTSVPPTIRKKIEENSRDQKVKILTDKSQDEFGWRIARDLGDTMSSIMVNSLIIEGKLIGLMAVCTKAKDSYTQAHAKLWELVNEPAAIALVNSQRYRELMQLKELLVDDNRYLQNELRQASKNQVIGADNGLKEVMEKIRQVAPLDSPVLILGETGVGKEVVANEIHNLSNRKENPFIKVNCGAIPDTLIDSELFGHEKGAFTGALSQKRGRFERAHKGTIFLDEIGELPLPAQTRMLRVLQNHEIERVGGEKAIPLDIRIITATHRNLEEMITSKEFREDLWFRLNVFPIQIPPLRERKEDIPPLVRYFTEKKALDLRIKNPPALEHGAIDRLMAHDWPGNIRELENAVERELIENQGREKGGLLRFDQYGAAYHQKNMSTGLERSDGFFKLDQMITMHIERALELSNGKIHGPGGAAELLGVFPTTLRSRMDKLGILYMHKK
jgi:transcriptional regulator with GAF, ATPase, and Fis domain